MMGLLGAGFHTLEATMVAREKLQTSIASNIANAETPNYQSDQRHFSDFLAIEQSHDSGSRASTTNPMHFADTDSKSSMSLSLFHHQTSNKMDGNTVDVQKEMARMSENQLMHELSMRLIKGKISGLKNAIKEGR